MATTALQGPRINRRAPQQRWMMWLVIIAIVVGGGYFAYQRYEFSTATAAVAPTTASVTRGNLASTVTATGNIEPATSADLNFTSGGVVKEVLVKVGDAITAGQALVHLQTTELDLAVTTAQASLDSANLKLQQAQQGSADTDITAAQAKVDSAQATLDALYAGPTAADLATAQAKLVSAQATLAKTRQGSATAADIASAQASIVTAQANLDKVKAGPTETEIANSKQQLEQAKNALWAAQSNRDAIGGRTKDPDNDSSYQNAKAQVNQQEATVQIAQNNLNLLLAGPDATDVTVAEQSLKQAQPALQKLTTVNANDVTVAQQSVNEAQAAVDALKAGPTDDAVAQAKATLTEAQSALDALKKGPDTLDVQVAQTAVTQAEVSLKQAQANLDGATLKAPFDGVVTAMTATVGTTMSTSGNPVSIADLNNMQITTQVSELDRAKLKVGQVVNVTLEALSGVTLLGEITAISPSGTSTSGVVNYPVTVKITKTDSNVAAGMTATLNIVTASKTGVLTVPSRAIQTVNGAKVVNVVGSDGTTTQVKVTTGLTDSSKTEVSSDELKEGDKVVVSGASTSSSASTTTSTTTRTQGAGAALVAGAGGPPPGN